MSNEKIFDDIADLAASLIARHALLSARLELLALGHCFLVRLVDISGHLLRFFRHLFACFSQLGNFLLSNVR